MDNIRPTSHAATAHPAPVKKPTQNQTPIRYRLKVEGILDSPDVATISMATRMIS